MYFFHCSLSKPSVSITIMQLNQQHISLRFGWRRLGDDICMDSKARLDTELRWSKKYFTSSVLVHRRSVSEGKQIRQGSGREGVVENRQESKKQKNSVTGNKAGMLITETKDDLAMDRGNTGTLYTPEGTGWEQVKGKQGGGRQSQWRENPEGQGKGIWNERKGKY